MKNLIIIASTIALSACLISCKEDHSALIQKIESSQLELHQQDSILTNQRNELSMVVYTDTIKQQKDDLVDTTFIQLVSKQNALITRLKVIIEKNNALIVKLNDNSANPLEVEKEYTSHMDELELMKAEINLAKENYTKIVAKADKAFENLGDTTKLK